MRTYYRSKGRKGGEALKLELENIPTLPNSATLLYQICDLFEHVTNLLFLYLSLPTLGGHERVK